MIELKVKGNIMNKPVNCGCGGNVDVHFFGNTYIGDYHKFTGKYFICCEKCGVETPICKTREKAIEIWNKAMGERTAKVVGVEKPIIGDEEGKTIRVTSCENCENVVSIFDNFCPNCGCRLIWGEDHE